MKYNLYVFNNTLLRRKQNTLCFETIEKEDNFEYINAYPEEYFFGKNLISQKGKKQFLPINKIEAIFVIGTTHFNSKLIYFLSKYNIPLHFCSYKGNYAGSFLPCHAGIDGKSLIKQMEAYSKLKLRLKIAKEILGATAHNTLCNLKYYNKKDTNLTSYINHIKELKDEIKNVNSINALMGIEGNIKKIYYGAWTKIFRFPVNFSKRVKNPPNNLINSLISYGNTIVYGVCTNEIYRSKLYPEIGFLHEPADSKLSLSFDIAEIFKPLITDRAIFTVINKKMITEEEVFPKSKQKGFLLNTQAKKIFVKEIDLKLTTKIKHQAKSKKISYKEIIRKEVYKLCKHIKEDCEYKPYKSKW